MHNTRTRTFAHIHTYVYTYKYSLFIYIQKTNTMGMFSTSELLNYVRTTHFLHGVSSLVSLVLKGIRNNYRILHSLINIILS